MKNLIITTLCVLFASTTVLAYPTQVSYNDGPQDPLAIPVEVHELGTAPTFDPYPEELIAADNIFGDIQFLYLHTQVQLSVHKLVYINYKYTIIYFKKRLISTELCSSNSSDSTKFFNSE